MTSTLGTATVQTVPMVKLAGGEIPEVLVSWSVFSLGGEGSSSAAAATLVYVVHAVRVKPIGVVRPAP